ncbi:MAG: type II toxin-antitoxin system VapC family toxin [Acidimicrobiia bacterium]
MIVVDASAAVFATVAGDGFHRFGSGEIAAPALLWSEVTSALRQMTVRRDITADVARAALRRLNEQPISRRTSARLLERAFTLAEDLGWAKTYDAEYVALAQDLRCPLVTVDARLRRGAAHLVEILGPADL